MGHIQRLEDLIGFLLRRGWIIALAIAVCTLLGAFYALQRPLSYTAAASVEMQSSQVAAVVTPGVIPPEPGAQALQMLQSVRHRLSTRQALLDLVERHGLFRDAPALTAEAKVQLLREAITFTTVRGIGEPTDGPPVSVTAIVISVTYSDPENAARIANDLAQGLLDMSATGQIKRAQDNFNFYASAMAGAETDIRAKEQEVAQFRSANADVLPPALDALRIESLGIASDLRGLDAQIVTATEERRRLGERETLRPTDRQKIKELGDQIALFNEQKAALNAAEVALQARLAGVPAVERDLAELERSLDQLKRNFDSANASLADAQAALQLAELHQGERFAILDRAMTPEAASGTSRRVYVLAAAVAGALLGLILAFLFDLLRPVVRTSAQLERELGLRPLIAIPELDLTPDRRPRRKARASAS